MSNQVFPALAGVTYPIVKRPKWSTSVLRSVSGKEMRLANYSYPLWEFELPYELLRNSTSYAELATLMGFYNVHQGGFDTFLFDDVEDNWVTGASIGTGTGAQYDFQLVRSMGGWIEPRLEIKASPVENIYLNSVRQTSGYTISRVNSGVLSFTSAPGAGVIITADYGFYYRVRFGEDEVDFEKFSYQFWQATKILLVSVK